MLSLGKKINQWQKIANWETKLCILISVTLESPKTFRFIQCLPTRKSNFQSKLWRNLHIFVLRPKIGMDWPGGVFRTQSNLSDEAFCKNSKQLNTINYCPPKNSFLHVWQDSEYVAVTIQNAVLFHPFPL